MERTWCSNSGDERNFILLLILIIIIKGIYKLW